MKILVVHEVDYVNKPFFEFQEFSEGLSSLGHDVTVLHLREGPRNPAEKVGQWVTVPGLHIDGSEITLVSPFFQVTGIFSRFLSVFAHLFLLIRIFLRLKPDIVLSYSVPTSGWTVALMGRLFTVPVVHRAIDVSHLLRSRLLAPLVRLSEIATYALSTSVSTHNVELRDYIQKTTRQVKKISIEDPPVFPIYASNKQRIMQDNQQLRLLFIGSLEHFTDLESILQSMASVDAGQRLTLRIVGSGSREQDLKRLASKLGLDHRVEFRGWKRRDEFPEELSWAQVGIIPFKKNLLTNCALPHKAIEYLSVGLPVVSTRLKGAESVLGAIEGVHFVDSSIEIVRRCISLAREQQLDLVDRELVCQRFSRELTIKGMEELLSSVVRNKKSK